jgi:hypothetical protein
MENIEALLDTDVLLNWLCKEVTPDGEVLWESPYKILKKAEAGKVNLYTTIVCRHRSKMIKNIERK